MQQLVNIAKLTVLSLLLTACAIGASDPNKVSNRDKAKKFTEVAIEYFRTGDNVTARNWLQKALEFDKSYARAYSILATVFQSEQEQELAEEYFRKSIKVAPDSAMFRNNFGAFLFGQKRYEEACIELELATKDPFYNLRAQALDNLGRCYQALKDNDKAGDAFQRSVNLGGRSAFALLNLSKTLLAAGETFKSNAKYKEFLDLISANQTQHSAESLALGIKLARVNGDFSEVVTYSLLLENLFPNKYKELKESAQ